MPKQFYRPNDPQIRQIGKFRNKPSIELSGFPAFCSRRQELDRGDIRGGVACLVRTDLSDGKKRGRGASSNLDMHWTADLVR